MSELRIPFEEAIGEARLLKPRFDELSLPQQTALKAIYGLPLSDSRRDRLGFSELDYFTAFQGFGKFDQLGFLLSVDRSRVQYTPHEYGECWLNEGVRSGKSTIASVIVAYESVCGGHEEFVRPGRRLYVFQIAQDLRQAKYALHDINANLEQIPFLMRPLKDGGKRIQNVTADRIDLWNGVTIATTPPTVKSVRGYDSPAAVLDEVAVWYQEADSANPDFEIYRQVKSRQAQFSNPKIVGLSSPWNKGGLLWSRVKSGTNGVNERCEDHLDGPVATCEACRGVQHPHRNRLVMTMPTAAMGNPNVTRQWLEEYKDADPRAFRRECLAEFLDSVSGFLDGDLIHSSVSKGRRKREPLPGRVYVAALDPGFKHDSFVLAVGHMEANGKMVYDVVERWTRRVGHGPLDPIEILARVKEIVRPYKIQTIFTDQHEVTSLKALALKEDLTLVEHSLQAGSKNDMWANFASLVNQRKLSLLDHEDSINELLSLERKLTQGGGIQISAPAGQHDDLATAIAMVAQHAIWLTPVMEKGDLDPYEIDDDPEKSVEERIADQIAQRWSMGGGEWSGGWD